MTTQGGSVRAQRPAGAGDGEGVEPHWTPMRLAAATVGGLVLGYYGTALHRAGQDLPWGLVVALAMVMLGSVFLRTLGGRLAVLTYLITVAIVMLVLTYAGPGGDVLVTGDTTSMAWLVLAPVAGFLGLLMPRRWFVDLPGREASSQDAVLLGAPGQRPVEEPAAGTGAQTAVAVEEPGTREEERRP